MEWTWEGLWYNLWYTWGKDKESRLSCVTPGEQRVASRTNAGFCNIPDWNSESLLMMWSAYVAGLVFSFTNVISFQDGLKYVNIFKIQI